MAFMENLNRQLQQEKQQTENGAIGYKTSGKYLLNTNFAVSSMRNWGESRIRDTFVKAYYENPLLAVKWLFYLRDIRGNGMGERRTFRICIKWLVKNHYEYVRGVVALMPEYGRYDDWLCLLDTEAREEIIQRMRYQLLQDMEALETGGQVSLLAKWLPSCNASSETTRKQAADIYRAFGLTEQEYRKVLSELRRYLRVVEVLMSEGKWSKIEYRNVPSRANLIYGKAFLRNDEMRRREFLDSLVCGEDTIHADTLFPSDIVAKYYEKNTRYMWRRGSLKDQDDTLEALWSALPDYVQNDSSTLVVRDGSGSMTVNIGNTKVSALNVATALAIYFAERCKGQFYNKFITFSENPQLVDLSNANCLRDKLEICDNYAECSNTDIQAVFQLILDTALTYGMPQEELPDNILIISDMEFDHAVTYPERRKLERWGMITMYESYSNSRVLPLFEQIQRNYKSHGYRIPRLVFWNVCSRTNTVPLQQHEAGAALVSGFNPAVYRMVLSDKLDPYECLMEQLENKRYDAVEQALNPDIFI